jgi:hypothetical protein
MYEDHRDTCHPQVLGVTGKVRGLKTRVIPKQTVTSYGLNEAPGWWLCNKLNAIRSKQPSVNQFRADLKDSRNADGIFVCSPANHLDRELTKKEHGPVYLTASAVQRH